MELETISFSVRRRQLSLDWIASNIQTVATLAAGFLTVRLLTRGVPLAEYGFWLTAGNIAGYLLIFQRGTSAALMRSSAEAWARRDPAAAAHSFRQLTTLMALCAVLASFAGGAGWLLVVGTYGASLAALVFWTFLSAGASMVLGAANAYLSGLGLYSAGRALLIAASIGNLALTLAVLAITTALWPLAALQTAWIILLAAVAGTFAFLRIRRITVPRFRSTGISDTLRLLHSGIGFLLTDLGYLIAYQSDNILVGCLLGPAQVVPLSLMQRIASTLHTILGAQHSPLLPALMKYKAIDAVSQIRAAYLTQMRRFGGVALIFAWGIVVFGRDAVSIWVGSRYYCGWAANLWVAVAFLAVALYRPTGLTLCAIGEERRCGKFAILEAVANVSLSILFILRFGVAGTVLATAVSHVAVTHAPLLRMLQGRLGIPARAWLAVVVRPWVPTTVVLALGTVAGLSTESPYLRLLLGVVTGLIGLTIGWQRGWTPVALEGTVSKSISS